MVSQTEIQTACGVICFHAQQGIEKYLKAWLQASNLPVPRTQDVQELLRLSVLIHPTWRDWESAFSMFRAFAVDARYPGYAATTADAQQALETCSDVRHAVRLALGLSVASEPQSD